MNKTAAISEPKLQPRPGGPNKPPPANGGGGDDHNENWQNQPQGRRGPRERLKRYRIGLSFSLISIFMLFVALSSAYVVRQGGERFDSVSNTYVHDWVPLHVPAILWLNTILLLLSSISIELARREVFRDPAIMEEWLGLGTPTRKAALPWLAITLILGTGFLVGQLLAWRQLNSQGIYLPTNPSSSFFFIITGTHAVHFLGGLVALCWAGVISLLKRPLESRQIATDITAWYWHAMGLLWVYVFALLLYLE